MRFCIVNLGCKVNRVEADQAAGLLIAAGMREASQDQADVIVVNTCTVTGEAEKKTRKAVRHALRANDAARVVVTGCASAVDPATYSDMDGRVVVVPKAQLFTYLSSQIAPHEAATALANAAELRVSEGFRTRVGVKVQDGCNNACTYCIVHVARGRARSMEPNGVIEEAVRLSNAGAKEIVLTGINLGTYDWGQDGTHMRLPQLLERMLEATKDAQGGAPRFRVSSIEPKNVDSDLIELMAASDGRVCRHLHLPLQAGSTKVLREMARPYNADFFAQLVSDMRSRIPQLALSTDIIAGFPGETDAEFDQTLQLARACRFMKIHSFPYSMRAGTPAAARTDQVPVEVKAARAAQLRQLSDQLAAQDLALRAGTTELALVEPGGIATCESYHVVKAPQDAEIGSLVAVAL